MDQVQIGKFIAEQRKLKGLTQEELGKLIGLSGVAIMRYEKGQREPNMETIEKIANVLNIHPIDLIGWKTVNEFENFIDYIKSIGYSVFIDQISEKEYSIRLQKDDNVAIFTNNEFELLQTKSKENLEGLILLQSKKNKNDSINAATDIESQNN